jgi:WhiB family redox-sensing transcriptional regulator
VSAAGDWRRRAACLGGDPNLFFPISDAEAGRAQAAHARRICQGCPVRTVCLEWAVDVGVTDGIWGGLDHRERRAWRREHHLPTSRSASASASPGKPGT